MKYDAYVVSTIDHSRKIKNTDFTDISIVMHELSPKLEAQKPHFILYLEFRDSVLGCTKLHNVQQAVDKSRRIIIVLTENFLKVCANLINHLSKLLNLLLPPHWDYQCICINYKLLKLLNTRSVNNEIRNDEYIHFSWVFIGQYLSGSF